METRGVQEEEAMSKRRASVETGTGSNVKKALLMLLMGTRSSTSASFVLKKTLSSWMITKLISVRGDRLARVREVAEADDL